MLIVQAMRPDRLQSAMSLFASRALGKVHSHNNQYFSVSLLAPLYIMLTCIYARLGWSLRIDVDFLKVFSWLVMPFKGLFIPVWREIFRSKILPVTSWQLTNRTVGDISGRFRHSICQSFFFRVYLWYDSNPLRRNKPTSRFRRSLGRCATSCIKTRFAHF